MTITQTVDIPESHKLVIDVPREIPAGVTARFELKVIPFENKEQPLKSLEGAATPRADRLLGAAANLGGITIDEIREERIAKHLV